METHTLRFFKPGKLDSFFQENIAIQLLTDLIVCVILILRLDWSSHSIAVMFDTALTSKLRISTLSGATKQGNASDKPGAGTEL